MLEMSVAPLLVNTAIPRGPLLFGRLTVTLIIIKASGKARASRRDNSGEGTFHRAAPKNRHVV